MIAVEAPRVLFALALILVSSSGRGQDSVDLPGVFSETIDVRVVNIEAVVTDGEGRRATGLGAADFRLLVDGEATPIHFFSEVRDRTAVESREPSGIASAPGVSPQGLSTSYLVFIDDFFTTTEDRNWVLQKMAEDLGHLERSDRMAVVAFDGTELAVLSGWTRHQPLLERTLFDARGRRAYGKRRLRELRSSEHLSAGVGSASSRLSPIEERYARLVGTQVEGAVLAAVATLRSFATPPGRKVMLLVSGGWPVSPAEYAIHRGGGAIGDAIEQAHEDGILGYDELFAPLTDAANLLGYTLYPIDAPGTAGKIDTDIPVGTLGGAGDTSFLGRTGNLHAAMRLLADTTGGRPLTNKARDEVLQRVAADTSSYYWLGFQIDRQSDGARHTIEVETLEPGLELRSRVGFVDLSRRSEMTMMAESSLLFGNPVGERPIELRFGKAVNEKRHRVRIAVEVGFLLDEITMLPSPEGVSAELEARVSALDHLGSRSKTTMDKIEIERPARPDPGEMHWYTTEVLLHRKRKHRVVVAIFDPLSGNIYSSAAEISP